MKRIKFKIIPLICVFALNSCDNQLDLAPTDILTEQEVFADKLTAESALADVYHKLFVASTGATHVIADASLPYLGLQLNNSYGIYFDGNLIADDFNVGAIWQNYYETINLANVFIVRIPQVATYDEVLEKQHIAEAKFNRAYAYWALLSFYGDKALIGNPDGLGVPLQLIPYDGFNPSDLIPRSTNAEVFAQIIKDLTEAIPDLPITHENDLKTRARATKATAHALLSRVYLYSKDYEGCLTASNEVLSNSNYELVADLRQVFPENTEGTTSRFSKETIFGFPVSGNNGNFQFGTHNIYYYFKNYWVDASFINSMDPDDKRRTELIYPGNPFNTNPNTINEKTTFKYNNNYQRDDIHVFRLAEIILNKAEALAQLNGLNSQSIDLLNDIRERSGLAPVGLTDFSSKEELLTALYNERYIETAFEGRARFDFIRTNRPLRNPNLTDDQKTFPIPKREIDLSEGILVQNPGYN